MKKPRTTDRALRILAAAPARPGARAQARGEAPARAVRLRRHAAVQPLVIVMESVLNDKITSK